jgi:hypothetical protein
LKLRLYQLIFLVAHFQPMALLVGGGGKLAFYLESQDSILFPVNG